MIYHPGYTKVLTADERMSCMRFGALLKCAEHGLKPVEVDALVKKATVSLTDTAKGIAAMAVLNKGSYITDAIRMLDDILRHIATYARTPVK